MTNNTFNETSVVGWLSDFVADNKTLWNDGNQGNGSAELGDQATAPIPVEAGARYTFYVQTEREAEMYFTLHFYNASDRRIRSLINSGAVLDGRDENGKFIGAWYNIQAPEGAVTARVTFREGGDKTGRAWFGKTSDMPASLKSNLFKVWEINERYSTPNAPFHVVAHRGTDFRFAEESYAAYLDAYRKGYRYLETDLRRTQDGVFVCMHDETPARTARVFDENGIINEESPAGISAGTTVYDRFGMVWNLAEMQAAVNTNIWELDFAALDRFDHSRDTVRWLNAGGTPGGFAKSNATGNPILTFEDYLKLCKDLNAYPVVEIRAQEDNEEAINTIHTLTAKYGLQDKVTYVSFILSTLEKMRTQNRHCILQFIHTSAPSEAEQSRLLALKTAPGNVGVSIDKSAAATAEMERFIVDNALTMDVWTIQGLLHMSLIPPYATSMTTSDTMPPSVWHYEKVASKF